MSPPGRPKGASSSAETREHRPMPAVLEVRDLTKTFGGISAVAGVSFEVRPGEILGLAKSANQKHYARRTDEFFDAKLLGKEAPDRYKDGVPRLKMDEHLKARRPAKPAPVP